MDKREDLVSEKPCPAQMSKGILENREHGLFGKAASSVDLSGLNLLHVPELFDECVPRLDCSCPQRVALKINK